MFVLRTRDDEKDAEKERDKPREKHRDRPRRTSRSQKKSTSNLDPKPSSPASSSARRKKRDAHVEAGRRETMAENASPSSSRTSLPYPSFSKAHSKESVTRLVGSADALTPESTELAKRSSRKSMDAKDGPDVDSEKRARAAGVSGGAPPSPPLTATSHPPKITTPVSRTGKLGEDRTRRKPDDASSPKKNSDDRPQSWFSRLSSGKDVEEKPSRTSSRTSNRSVSALSKSKLGPPKEVTSCTVDKKEEASSAVGNHASSDLSQQTGSTIDSDATSLARDHPQHAANLPAPSAISNNSSPTSYQDSSPQIPTHASPQFPLAEPESKPSPIVLPRTSAPSPKPPPPPPPPTMPVNLPRVDYLLHNGGLLRSVPPTLLGASSAGSASAYQLGSPRIPPTVSVEIQKIFAPYHSLLDQYNTVLSKSGSIAVATGYKSVARRLLDRLENVFARDISYEVCRCFICAKRSSTGEISEPGLGWGEVLEWVSGRRDVPTWPAFDFDSLGDPARPSELMPGLGISTRFSGAGLSSPSPPIDADVPEEHREQFLRQSKKTKQNVDRWLTSQPANPSSPPPEVDDETLNFAIITHLDKTERPTFTSLLTTTSSIYPPGSRAPTPMKSRSELLVKTGGAIQRLYRLPAPPRDPETAVFLLKHPSLHNLLATLAAISSAEWDVLTSGRFDGFLWSGADDPITNASPHLSRNPTPFNRAHSSQSRSTTPFSIGGGVSRSSTPFHLLATAASRGTTPAPGPPVPHDEETEIAVLAEVEREIYVGMEVLEDAFEALHRKAEDVRRALRERGAGLSMAGQARRNPLGTGNVEVVSGTPGLSSNATGEWESESEGGWGAGGDASSELWPDDSASNVSTSRVRRPKRRNERRTPALVEESGEDDGF